ncbi:hypothetical protein OFO10_07015 [Campylobacter sp. VBCF_06 NA8]|uniref:hypothetical protein n=1 Tax=Campylobacter sp. VBCF_06 NA8 TaxID=2983822 RepID=UPI0022E9D16B|nr:hypothetical protein [Campylobacter sp. VBCF_06 NA8]MDA3046906.1 hypothetical protein [Campylobacter sp. VBCF_06 NA8]
MMNSNKRDYDKEPIIIKDKSIDLTKMFSLLFIFIDFLKYFSPYRQATAYKFGEFGDCYVIFKNENIELFSTKKNAILTSINLKNIIAIKRTYALSEPVATKQTKIFGLCVVLFGLSIMSLRFAVEGKFYALLLPFGILLLLVMPILIYMLKNNLEFSVADSLIIYGEQNFIEVAFLSRNEYNEIKRYFLSKTGINLDKIVPQIFI